MSGRFGRQRVKGMFWRWEEEQRHSIMCLLFSKRQSHKNVMTLSELFNRRLKSTFCKVGWKKTLVHRRLRSIVTGQSHRQLLSSSDGVYIERWHLYWRMLVSYAAVLCVVTQRILWLLFFNLNKCTGCIWHKWHTWLLWMETAQANLRGNCRRVIVPPPGVFTSHFSGPMTCSRPDMNLTTG